MKKVLFIAAIAIAALASCTKNEVLPNTTDQNAIKFDVYTGRAPQAKGAETTLDTFGNNGSFGVNAIHTTADWSTETAPNFMFAQEVKGTRSGSAENYTYSWEYNPTKYWPTTQTDRVSFFAWAPFSAVTLTTPATSTTKATEIPFTISTTASSMVDLVAATALNKNDKADNGADAVNFAFKHILSRLNFTATTDETLADNSYVVIKSATIKAGGELYANGKFTYDNTNVYGKWTEKNATTGEADLETATIWNTADAETTYGSYKTKNPTISKSVTSVGLFKTSQYLFLIPVTPKGDSEAGTTASTTLVEFTYDIVTVDDKLDGGNSLTTATKQVYLPANILKQGVAYNVTFTFGVDKVEVAAVSVEGWGSETPGSGNVDYSDTDITSGAGA